MESLKKLYTVIINILITIFVLIITLYIAARIGQRLSKFKIPEIANIGFIDINSSNNLSFLQCGDMAVVKESGEGEFEKGDTIFFTGDNNTITAGSILDIGEGIIAAQYNVMSPEGIISLDQGMIVGRCIWVIPKFGFVIEFLETTVGIVACILLPGAFILFYFFIQIVDRVHETSRHRKMILRRRKRRSERYRKEGMNLLVRM